MWTNIQMTIRMCRQAGVTLVETMISLTLGAIIAVGVMQLFAGNSATHNLLVGQSRLQESARFALESISRATQQAGYKGCYSSNESISRSFLVATPYEFDIEVGMQGFEGETSSWSPDLTLVMPTTINGVDTNVYTEGGTSKTGIDTSQLIHATDVITLRYLSQVDHRLLVDMPTSQEDPIVEMPATGLELQDGHLALFHDCEKATVFKITNISLHDPAANQATLSHDTSGTIVQNAITSLAEFNTFETDASVTAIESHTFFIAPGAGRNTNGDTPLSLWRKSGVAAPIELVEGVENMQILYGLDNDNDDVPNRYVTAALVADWDDVVTAKFSVTVNSVDDVGATSSPTWPCGAALNSATPPQTQACITGKTYDGLLRRTFSQTMQLRNQG